MLMQAAMCWAIAGREPPMQGAMDCRRAVGGAALLPRGFGPFRLSAAGMTACGGFTSFRPVLARAGRWAVRLTGFADGAPRALMPAACAPAHCVGTGAPARRSAIPCRDMSRAVRDPAGARAAFPGDPDGVTLAEGAPSRGPEPAP
jgi:hypothetical protein